MTLSSKLEHSLLDRLSRTLHAARQARETAGPPESAPVEPAADVDALRLCVANGSLRTTFQPILELRSGRIFGYEALTLGPGGSPIETADCLFGLARRCGLGAELERLAARLALQRFGASGARGRLFVNFSPGALEAESLSGAEILAQIRPFGLAPNQVVIELTEQESLSSRSTAWDALLRYRSLGFEIAIDDLGEGFASLRLWSELRPEHVKVDRHFISRCSHDPLKLQMVRAIQQIAQTSGSNVIAEGIDDEGDFMAIRDLGIRLGQGYLIARPAPVPEADAAERSWRDMADKPVPAFPEPAGLLSQVTARRLLHAVAPVSPATGNDVVFERFETDPDLSAVPVVDGCTPVGIINRLTLIDRFARPYRRELFSKRDCTMFMNPRPVIVDVDTPLQEISQLVSDAGQYALADGIIITRLGEYLGMGSASDLMREITEQQLTAARYANPLTLLPGNVPIAQHIQRLMSQGREFAACHCDLDHFKPFNDIYGYQRGDDAIVLTGKVLAEACEPRFDFLGHIGGDDFIVLFQSPDWEQRCNDALGRFRRTITPLFSDSDVALGGFLAEDRSGRLQKYPLTSLSIGAVHVVPGLYASHYEISAAAAEAKKLAKRTQGGSVFAERRRPAANAAKAPAPPA